MLLKLTRVILKVQYSPKLFIFYINEILRKIDYRLGANELILAYADYIVLIS
jgi:hypothetical protein